MDIMLDLETFGTRHGSVIVSIGACAFDRRFGFMDALPTLHLFVKPKEQIEAGAQMDPSTVLWWLGQSDEARKAMIEGQAMALHPTSALMLLDNWFNGVCPEPKDRVVWANGQDFDLALLAQLYQRFGRAAPWPYNAGRDMRTVFDLVGCKPADIMPAPAGAHDALVDAIYQADVMAKALSRFYAHAAA